MNRHWLNAPLRTGEIGTISELKVSVDLFNKGWSVFRAMSHTSRMDLMAMKYEFKIAVEVKTARKNKNGKLSYQRKELRTGEYLALVLKNQIIYLPDLPDIHTDILE